MDDRRISIEELRQQQRDNWPEVYAVANPALLRLVRLSDLIHREAAKTLQDANLLSAEFDVLAALRRQTAPHIVSPTELCRALLISSGGLTKVLYRLQERGLISRPPNPNDGRSLLVALTDAGKSLVELAMEGIMALHKQQVGGLSEKELTALDQVLEKMLQQAEQRNLD